VYSIGLLDHITSSLVLFLSNYFVRIPLFLVRKMVVESLLV